MEFHLPDFLRGHSWTPPCHPCFPPSWLLFLNSISAPLQPQFSPIGPCFSPSPPPSSGGTSRLLGTPPQAPGVPFWWHLEPHHKWGSWLGCWCGCGVHTAAWKRYTWHMRGTDYEGNYEKIIIISIIIKYSSWGVYQAILPGTHTPLAGVRTLHLHCGISIVLLQLLSPSLLGGLLLLISGGDLLALRPCDLGSFSLLQ